MLDRAIEIMERREDFPAVMAESTALRAYPADGAVLLGGCDKTVPAQLMGAFSAGRPAIQLVTGSMLTGSHRSARNRCCAASMSPVTFSVPTSR